MNSLHDFMFDLRRFGAWVAELRDISDDTKQLAQEAASLDPQQLDLTQWNVLKWQISRLRKEFDGIEAEHWEYSDDEPGGAFLQPL